MFAKAVGVIVFVVILGFQVFLLSAMVMRVFDRRALRRRAVGAFRRGVVISTARGLFRSSGVRTIQSIETAHGAGQWLADDTFGFWAREAYTARSHYFAWVGLCRVAGESAVYEARLLRSSALNVAAMVAWLFAMCLGSGGVGYLAGGFVFGALALGVATLLSFLFVRTFRRELSLADEVVQEFRERFERS